MSGEQTTEVDVQPEQAEQAEQQVQEEAPAVVEKQNEKDELAERLSTGMSALVRREREFRAEREKFAAEVEANKSRISRVQELEELLSKDPVAALEKMGIDFATLAERTLRGNTEETEVAKLRRELKEKEEAFEARQKRAAEESVAATMKNVENVIHSGKDERWELCFKQYKGATPLAAEAMEFARRAYEEGFPAIGIAKGTALSIEETLDKIEELISEDVLNYVDTKRIAGKIKEREQKKRQSVKASEENAEPEIPKAATQRSSRVISGVTKARKIGDETERRAAAMTEFIQRLRKENGNT